MGLIMGNGKQYEEFVGRLQQAILNSEEFLKIKNITIEKNRIITDNNGIEREFDLYWEYDLGGITYKSVIECKDYNKKISIEKIDALIGKISDIPNIYPIFATKIGYQSGAKIKAERKGVELLIVREQCENDWVADDGTPYLREIGFNIQINTPVKIYQVTPQLDGQWILENTDIDVTKPLVHHSRNDQIYVNDKIALTRKSIHQLEIDLTAEYKGIYGDFTKTYHYDDAYLEVDDYNLKLISLDIEFRHNPPFSLETSIDFSKELIGVIEYLRSGKKTAVYKDRVTPDWR